MGNPRVVFLVIAALVAGVAQAAEPVVLAALRPAPERVSPVPTAAPVPAALPSPRAQPPLTRAELAADLARVLRANHLGGTRLPERTFATPREVLEALDDPAIVYTGSEPEPVAPEAAALEPASAADTLRDPTVDELIASFENGDQHEPLFSWSGIVTGASGRNVILAGVQDGSPAWLAGLRAGDRILEIDGRPTAGVPPWYVAGQLAIIPIDPLVLKVERPGAAPLTVKLAFTGARVDAKPQVRRLSDGHVLVRIPAFDENGAEALETALASARKAGAITGVVIDLRANPGGNLTAVVNVARILATRKSVLVRVKGRTEETLYKQYGDRPQLPLAVLVDDGTGGGAEVFAQLLRENADARIFGRRTMGRNAVYMDAPLRDASFVRVRIGTFLTGRGTSVAPGGVAPDEEVLSGDRHAMDPARDGALSAALSWLRR